MLHKFSPANESSGRLLKHKLLGPTPEFQNQSVWGGGTSLDVMYTSSSREILLLLVLGPHFANHWAKQMNILAFLPVPPPDEPTWYTSEMGSLEPSRQHAGSIPGLLFQIFSWPILQGSSQITALCNLIPWSWQEEWFWFSLLGIPSRDMPGSQVRRLSPGNHYISQPAIASSQRGRITMKANVYLHTY